MSAYVSDRMELKVISRTGLRDIETTRPWKARSSSAVTAKSSADSRAVTTSPRSLSSASPGAMLARAAASDSSARRASMR
ncbi:MAG TPA: hypothetical protein VKV80_14285 [Streptosporangiaceae bacterium]|nr:hypothetical protein [Streptosporangiaceae bacterium]